MNILLSILTFLFGISIGSFLNVLIDRIPRGESFAKGRSHCEFCKHVLAWYDLIPLVSFTFLQGKCRYCKKFIGLKYPLVELTTGIAFVLLLFTFQQPFNTVSAILSVAYLLIIYSSFIVIFYTDLWSGIIPDIVLFPVTGIAFAYLFYISPQDIVLRFFAGLGGLFFFLALFLFTKGRGMGFGDVKLAFFLGLILGYPGIFLAIYLAFLTGAVVALILILWRKKRFFGSTIPFGPFLIFGAIISWFWGPLLWQKILTMF